MSEKSKIVVIEDDEAIRNLITTTLEANDYDYISAKDGQNGVFEIMSRKPDVVFLDLGLPDMDGIEIIRKVRTWSNVPIIVISARNEDEDKILALDAGADDYLTKPFSIDELLARLRVTLRRSQYMKNTTMTESYVFENGNLKIDYDAGNVFVDGEEIHMTPIEYKILVILSKNVGRVLTHTYITKEIWGTTLDADVASLRVYVATLRKKIEKNSNTSMIQTHVGVGYRMLKV